MRASAAGIYWPLGNSSTNCYVRFNAILTAAISLLSSPGFEPRTTELANQPLIPRSGSIGLRFPTNGIASPENNSQTATQMRTFVFFHLFHFMHACCGAGSHFQVAATKEREDRVSSPLMEKSSKWNYDVEEGRGLPASGSNGMLLKLIS
jgi:hypothetical protein